MALFEGLQAELLTKLLKKHMEKKGITLIAVTMENDNLQFRQFSTPQIIIEKEKLAEFLREKKQIAENE